MLAISVCSLRGTLTLTRCFSTSVPLRGRRNSRRYPKTIMDVPDHQKKMFEGRREYEYPDGLEGFGVQEIGVKLASTGKYVVIPEMIPELVVPDLKDFPLKPYVSFRVPDVTEPELTARDLYDAVYGRKLKDDFETGALEKELEQVQERERQGTLKVPTYDREPPRMLISSKVPIV